MSAESLAEPDDSASPVCYRGVHQERPVRVEVALQPWSTSAIAKQKVSLGE